MECSIVNLISENIVYLLLTIVGISCYLLYCRYRVTQKWKKSLKGKVVLVTGSAGGLGKELCLTFAHENCHIICVDIDTKGNEDTVEKIKEIAKSSKIRGYTVDITNIDKVKELYEEILKEFPQGIDILVNNAGVAYPSPFLDVTNDHIRRLFEINLLSHFWLIKTFLPKMIQRDSGHIVAIGSLAGIFGWECLVPYSSSKFGVTGLMESLTYELLHMNSKVKTLCVMPSLMNTKLAPKEVYEKGSGYQVFNNMAVKVSDVKDVAQGIINAIKDERRIYGTPYLHYLICKLLKLLPQFLFDPICIYLLKVNTFLDKLTKID